MTTADRTSSSWRRLAVGMAVVPAGECARADDARKFFAWNAEPPIAPGARCQHHRIVERHQLFKPNVTANFDIAEEADAFAREHAIEHPRHRLRALMVGSNSVANQSERHGQPLEDVDGSVGNQSKQVSAR